MSQTGMTTARQERLFQLIDDRLKLAVDGTLPESQLIVSVTLLKELVDDLCRKVRQLEQWKEELAQEGSDSIE